MKFDLKDIINKHKNKTAFVIANGPSTKNFLDIFKKASKEKDKYCIIVCNEIDQMLETIGLDLMNDLNPDFWVLANSIQTVSNYYNGFNKLKNNGIFVYADSVDLTENTENYLNINYIPYDQRHFNMSACKEGFRKCCQKCLIDKNPKKTIQEYLSDYCDHHIHYGTGSTVALHMLSLAILIGCNKIFLSGIELNYKLGYFDNKTVNYDSFEPWLNEILNDFIIIRDSAKNINVEIINLSEISMLKHIFNTYEINNNEN